MLTGNNKILIIFIALQICFCEILHAQDLSKLLIGKWENIKREKIDGRQRNALNEVFRNDYRWEFTVFNFIDHFSLKDKSIGYYRVDKSILIIGNDRYIIEELTNESLIIVRINPLLGYPTKKDDRDYFKRVKLFDFEKKTH